MGQLRPPLGRAISLIKTLGFIANHPVNRRRRSRALLEFLKWQLGSRLLPGGVVVSWINGSRLIVRRGDTGLTGNLYCGLHEFSDMAYVLHVLRPGDHFADVGANLGAYTILACAAAGALGHCFEPVPTTYARLVENLRLNDLTERVKAMNVGIGEQETELAFSAGSDTTNHVLAADEPAQHVVRMRVLPLDSALDGRAPSVLKIDVEGFETPVIRGAMGVLRDQGLHSVIIELNGSCRRYGYDEDQIVLTLRNLGFTAYRYDPLRRELLPHTENKKGSDNTLFIRNQDFVRERLKSAPRFTVKQLSI